MIVIACMPQSQLKMLRISLSGILKGYAKKIQDFRELLHGFTYTCTVLS